jgi:hypothetical protein
MATGLCSILQIVQTVAKLSEFRVCVLRAGMDKNLQASRRHIVERFEHSCQVEFEWWDELRAPNITAC